MESKIEKHEGYFILKVYRRMLKTYVDVLMDNKYLDYVSSKEWIIKTQKNNIHYVFSKESNENLKKYIENDLGVKSGIIRIQDDILDYRESNLKKNEIDKRIRKQNFIKRDKEKLIKCMQDNRYNKEYSISIGNNKRGEENYISKVTQKDVDEMRKIYYATDMTQEDVASKYGIARGTVADILSFRTWIDVYSSEECDFNKENVINVKIDDIQKRLFIDLRYEDISFHKNTYLVNDEFYIFVLKTKTDGLIYVEYRDVNKEFVFSSYIYLPKEINYRQKRSYMISKKNPKKTDFDIIETTMCYLNEIVN